MSWFAVVRTGSRTAPHRSGSGGSRSYRERTNEPNQVLTTEVCGTTEPGTDQHSPKPGREEGRGGAAEGPRVPTPVGADRRDLFAAYDDANCPCGSDLCADAEGEDHV